LFKKSLTADHIQQTTDRAVSQVFLIFFLIR
jgi:hypothetical protein